jgi:nitroreductase
MENNIIECMETRVSVRRFTDQPVEAGKVETILRAGMAAPTAANTQPWHFMVVTDSKKLHEIEQYRSPLAIVVCGDMDKTMDMGREWWITDTSAASENILLAAHALGLGGIWTALFPLEEYMDRARSVLDLPENLVPLNVIILGYPGEEPQPKNKWDPEKITYVTE